MLVYVYRNKQLPNYKLYQLYRCLITENKLIKTFLFTNKKHIFHGKNIYEGRKLNLAPRFDSFIGIFTENSGNRWSMFISPAIYYAYGTVFFIKPPSSSNDYCCAVIVLPLLYLQGVEYAQELPLTCCVVGNTFCRWSLLATTTSVLRSSYRRRHSKNAKEISPTSTSTPMSITNTILPVFPSTRK